MQPPSLQAAPAHSDSTDNGGSCSSALSSSSSEESSELEASSEAEEEEPAGPVSSFVPPSQRNIEIGAMRVGLPDSMAAAKGLRAGLPASTAAA